MKVDINIKGVDGFKHQVIDVKGKKGKIDINGEGTDKKIEILAKGNCKGEKVDVVYSKEIGQKAEMKVKKCPKKQVKHFKRKCDKIADIWEKQAKAKQPKKA